MDYKLEKDINLSEGSFHAPLFKDTQFRSNFDKMMKKNLDVRVSETQLAPPLRSWSYENYKSLNGAAPSLYHAPLFDDRKFRSNFDKNMKKYYLAAYPRE